ncbi:hypothetical protein LG324_10395 [Phycicoccus jejuensis]|uniref:hypothetical protein n=1 Tax=Phycicoccus jejuensis TaxID=367299 RepID=UPI00385057B9
MASTTRRRPAKTAARARTPEREPTTTVPVTPAPRTAAPVVPAPAAALAGLGAPAGLGAGVAAADVSGQLRAVAPTFGDVLKSIGIGVADSQAALDQGVIDTVNELADTNITVVTDVIQHLDDDGLPVAADTELVSTDLSVLNFFMPTVHEWKRVALSMDLSCGAFNESDGLTFSAKQSGGGIGGAGLFWGFLGVNYEYGYENTQDVRTSHEQEASWSSGEVRLDAILGPRTTGKLPVPSQVAIGPQIVFSQGPVKETAVAGAGVNRSVDVVVTVRKAGGDVNPSVPLRIEAGGLRTSFSTTAPFTGNSTNAEGQVLVTVTRNVPNAGAAGARVTLVARLGAMSQSYALTI